MEHEHRLSSPEDRKKMLQLWETTYRPRVLRDLVLVNLTVLLLFVMPISWFVSVVTDTYLWWACFWGPVGFGQLGYTLWRRQRLKQALRHMTRNHPETDQDWIRLCGF